MAADLHPWYGSCDAMGPLGACSECVGRVCDSHRMDTAGRLAVVFAAVNSRMPLPADTSRVLDLAIRLIVQGEKA